MLPEVGVLIGKLSISIDLIVLSMATGSISMVVTKAEVFQPVRKWLIWVGQHVFDPIGWFITKNATCPYCLSHWVSAALVYVYRPNLLISRWAWVDFLVTTFAIVLMSAVCCSLIYKAFAQMSPAEEDEE